MRSQKDDFAKETHPQVQTVYRVKLWILKQNFSNWNEKQTLSASHCLSGGENVVCLNKKRNMALWHMLHTYFPYTGKKVMCGLLWKIVNSVLFVNTTIKYLWLLNK